MKSVSVCTPNKHNPLVCLKKTTFVKADIDKDCWQWRTKEWLLEEWRTKEWAFRVAAKGPLLNGVGEGCSLNLASDLSPK